MSRADVVLAIFLFFCYSVGIFGFGYNVGFNSAIEQMKKVRNRK